jgi:hypothetical protein
MKLSLVLLVILNVLLATTNERGRYFTEGEINKIIDQTTYQVSNAIANDYIDYMQEQDGYILELIAKQKENVSELSNRYEYKISLIEQKWQLKLDSAKITGRTKNFGWFWGGFAVGVSATAGVVFLMDSIEMPLFKITF